MAKGKRLGAVVVFPRGMSRKEAESLLEDMVLQRKLDGNYHVGGVPPVNEFREDDGGPVWYVP